MLGVIDETFKTDYRRGCNNENGETIHNFRRKATPICIDLEYCRKLWVVNRSEISQKGYTSQLVFVKECYPENFPLKCYPMKPSFTCGYPSVGFFKQRGKFEVYYGVLKLVERIS